MQNKEISTVQTFPKISIIKVHVILDKLCHSERNYLVRRVVLSTNALCPSLLSTFDCCYGDHSIPLLPISNEAHERG